MPDLNILFPSLYQTVTYAHQSQPCNVSMHLHVYEYRISLYVLMQCIGGKATATKLNNHTLMPYTGTSLCFFSNCQALTGQIVQEYWDMYITTRCTTPTETRSAKVQSHTPS